MIQELGNNRSQPLRLSLLDDCIPSYGLGLIALARFFLPGSLALMARAVLLRSSLPVGSTVATLSFLPADIATHPQLGSMRAECRPAHVTRRGIQGGRGDSVNNMIADALMGMAGVAKRDQVFHAVILRDSYRHDVMDSQSAPICFRCLSAVSAYLIAFAHRSGDLIPTDTVMGGTAAKVWMVRAAQVCANVPLVNEQQRTPLHAAIRHTEHCSTAAHARYIVPHTALCESHLTARFIRHFGTFDRHRSPAYCLFNIAVQCDICGLTQLGVDYADEQTRIAQQAPKPAPAVYAAE